MDWIARHRNESTAFVVSLGAHALLLANAGSWTTPGGSETVLVATIERSASAAVISVVSLASQADPPPSRAVSVEATPAPPAPDRTADLVAQRPPKVERPSVDELRPSPDASIAIDTVSPPPDDESDENEDTARLAARTFALERARAVNLAHMRERERKRGPQAASIE